MRLRATKDQRNARDPGGSSETTAPRPAMAAWRARLLDGYGTSALPARTATGAPARAGGDASAPAWAAASMPRASPETTGTPAAARPRPSARATSSPYGDARRAP